MGFLDFLTNDDNDETNVTINADGYEDGTLYRTCPHCGEQKPIEDFGFRDMGDSEIRNQSWCKDCR